MLLLLLPHWNFHETRWHGVWVYVYQAEAPSEPLYFFYRRFFHYHLFGRLLYGLNIIFEPESDEKVTDWSKLKRKRFPIYWICKGCRYFNLVWKLWLTEYANYWIKSDANRTCLPWTCILKKKKKKTAQRHTKYRFTVTCVRMWLTLISIIAYYFKRRITNDTHIKSFTTLFWWIIFKWRL